KRRSKYLELVGRSPSFINIGAFKKTKAWIQIDRLIIWQIWGRFYRKAVLGLVVIIFHRYYLKFTLYAVFQPFFSIDHFGIFSHCKSVSYRYGVHSHKTGVFGFQDWPVYIMPIWIWAVKYY